MLSSWVGQNACSSTAPWAGVTCDPATGLAIIVLDLGGYGLSGTFSSDPSVLTWLHQLQVSVRQQGAFAQHTMEHDCPGVPLQWSTTPLKGSHSDGGEGRAATAQVPKGD